MARHPLPPRPQRVPGYRTAPMNVRLTDAERGLVVRAARAAGLPPSVYLRDVVLAHAAEYIGRPRRLPRFLPDDQGGP